MESRIHPTYLCTVSGVGKSLVLCFSSACKTLYWEHTVDVLYMMFKLQILLFYINVMLQVCSIVHFIVFSLGIRHIMFSNS